mmetsp:Transcript_36696/g.68032  ORF Transcript_36696/g.68032 Transcript_36696/m.68032 type:complete len:113 (+) Transcript_36696:338-676(+)
MQGEEGRHGGGGGDAYAARPWGGYSFVAHRVFLCSSEMEIRRRNEGGVYSRVGVEVTSLPFLLVNCAYIYLEPLECGSTAQNGMMGASCWVKFGLRISLGLISGSIAIAFIE